MGEEPEYGAACRESECYDVQDERIGEVFGDSLGDVEGGYVENRVGIWTSASSSSV